MKTLYINDGLSEYVLNYSITMMGRVYVYGIIHLAGIRILKFDLISMVHDHLKEMGIKYEEIDLRFQGKIE